MYGGERTEKLGNDGYISSAPLLLFELYHVPAPGDIPSVPASSVQLSACRSPYLCLLFC